MGTHNKSENDHSAVVALCVYPIHTHSSLFNVYQRIFVKKAKAVPLHATKALEGGGGVAPTQSRSRQ
jgi:hypothetical protein